LKRLLALSRISQLTRKQDEQEHRKDFRKLQKRVHFALECVDQANLYGKYKKHRKNDRSFSFHVSSICGLRFVSCFTAILPYADVQVNATDHTFANERDKIQEMDQRNRDRAYEASKPTMQEAAKAAGVSAALEGGTAFCIAVYKKLKAGKKISEFTAEDWKELGVDTAKGAGTGGIRGAAIYGMTNFTATPAAIASACVTAAIGMAAQSQKLRAGEITEDDFVNSSEVLCLDVSVSAVASLIGQTVIPIPVLGAVIGNVAGMFMYGIAKDHLSEKEQTITERFLTEMHTLDQVLEFKYQKFIELLRKEFAKYKSILELAFDPQANIAFANSITLAELVGVSDEKILREKSNIDTYFLN